MVSSIHGVGKTGHLICKRMRSEHSLTQHTKINSKWIKDLNVRPDTVKLLEQNIEHSMTYCHNIFLDLSPKGNFKKIHKRNLIKAFA